MESEMMNTFFLRFGKLQDGTSRIVMLRESPKKVQEPVLQPWLQLLAIYT